MLSHLLARLTSPVLALADRRPADADAIRPMQERQLRRLLAEQRALPVGRCFGLDRLADSPHLIADWRQRVRLTAYADYADLFARVARNEADVLFPGRAVALAQTSGTTSSAAAGERFIPQSAGLLRHHRLAGMASFARLLASSGSSLFDGKLLMMGGSTDLRANAHGVPSGDLSGIVIEQIPPWLRGLYEPGREIALERDWPRKLERMVARLRQADVRLASGIGSWLIMLFEHLCAARGVSCVREVWPRLDAVIHGGHAIEPLLPQLRHHLAPTTWLHEVYPASEAYLACGTRAWQPHESGPPPLELLLDHGVYQEFCPESADGDPTACVGAESLLPGVVYRVLITTPGGLVRYALGDLVVGVAPGLVRFAGRIKTRISVFGEHVEGFQLAAALAAACSATATAVAHSHVAPILPAPGETRGGHEWIVEFAGALPDAETLARFSATIDAYLRREVIDYDAHRDVQLHPPRITPVPAGRFAAWLARSGKLGGQHKVPQAWPDRSIAEALLS